MIKMTKKELFKLHKNTTKNAFMICRKKNSDYTGMADPFTNFRASANLGVPPERGILIRIQDKISRLNSFISRGKFEVAETIEDTVIDVVNYIILAYAMMEEKRLNGDLNVSYEKLDVKECPHCGHVISDGTDDFLMSLENDAECKSPAQILGHTKKQKNKLSLEKKSKKKVIVEGL